MGIMSFLRNRAGVILTGAMGFAIIAFLLGDVVKTGTPFWAKSRNQVGEINGNSIDYQSFNQQVEQTAEGFRQQMGGGSINPQMKTYAVQQVWNQFISKEILGTEVEKIGLSVGKSELNDLVSGVNPSYQIVQAFTNPETGQFDRAQLNGFIQQVGSLAANNPAAQQWEQLLEAVSEERLSTKYTTLLNNSVYVTSLEANDEYQQRNKLANFKYVLLDYADVKDADVKLTDADFKEYYNQHKNGFKNQEETRSIEYAIFDASPVAKDTAEVLAVVQKLKTDLIASTNDSLFAATNSENKYPYTYFKKGQVSPALDSVIFNVAAGTTVGPFLSNGVYELAKVMDTKFSPDSVKASHILLNPTAEGGLDKAKAKADSIKGLLAKGESFSALAVQFSQDPGSKNLGGDLGTFARGRMVPEFENAAFNGKPGDISITTTQHGVHIIKIENQIGNSKVVKAAIVDKAILSGRETINSANDKANKFLVEANAANFADVAKKLGAKTGTAANITGMDNALDGNEAPRELFRWAYEADKGDISDKTFETENSFIVVRLANISPKGILPLEAVKKEIEPAVKNQVKARLLAEKAKAASNGSASIDQIAQKLGKSAIPVENIVLANPVIPGVSLEYAVIGTVFGLQPNKPSAPVEGNQGVYVVQVNGFVNPAAPTDLEAQKKQILAGKSQRAWGAIFSALQEKAAIVDNRVRFF